MHVCFHGLPFGIRMPVDVSSPGKGYSSHSQYSLIALSSLYWGGLGPSVFSPFLGLAYCYYPHSAHDQAILQLRLYGCSMWSSKRHTSTHISQQTARFCVSSYNSILSSTVILEPLEQKLFCRYAHWDPTPLLCIQSG